MKSLYITFFQCSLLSVLIACKQDAVEEKTTTNQQEEKSTIPIIEPQTVFHLEIEIKVETITGKLATANSIEGESYYHVDVNGIDYLFFNYERLFGGIKLEGENVPKAIIVNNGREFLLSDSLKGRDLIIEYEKLSNSEMIEKYKIEPMISSDTIRIVRKMIFK